MHHKNFRYIGATAVDAARVTAGSSKQAEASSLVPAVDEDEVPVLINRELACLKDVLDAADVVVEVLDARDPMVCHSSHLVDLVKAKEGQKILLVLNKIGQFRSNLTGFVLL